MVVSLNEHASQAGIDILKKGGNAIDAAVAVGFTLAVTRPENGNIGGGGFVIGATSDGKIFTQDHREKAPYLSKKDMFLDENGEVDNHLARSTLLSSGVPGSVDGLITLLQRYGTLSLPQVIAPAIKLARDGFEIDWYVARHFAWVRPKMIKHAASIAKFSVAGRPPKQGDIWRQPELASTLQRISDEGRKGFYEGKTADLIVSEMQRSGGIISYEDLADYRSVWREPVKGSYRGYDIWSMGPPSSGGALLIQILNMF